MHETHQKGEIAQLKVQMRTMEKGVALSKPLVTTRYDFILDDGRRLERVQVKYASKPPTNSNGYVVVHLKKWRGRKQVRTYSSEEVDALLVYVPQIDKVLRFEPKLFCGRTSFVVRIEPTKSGQQKGILFAEKYIW